MSGNRKTAPSSSIGEQRPTTADLERIAAAYLRLQHYLHAPSKELQFGRDGPMLTRHDGKPSDLQRFEHGGQIVFRHYVTEANQAAYEAILASSSLRAGTVPYTESSRGSTVRWDKILGVFLTDPDHDPADVGVAHSPAYVDVMLSADTPILFVREGIYVVAAKPGMLIDVTIVGAQPAAGEL